MNFDIAAELLEEEGITVKTVRVTDDISAAPPERMQERRGVAGDMYVLKLQVQPFSPVMTLTPYMK